MFDKIIENEITGKYSAIHAYDRLMWTVRTGFLTLSFAGWGILIKSAVETKVDPESLESYVIILAMFSLTLATSGYLIDSTYAKRKYRVIYSVNSLMELITKYSSALYNEKNLELLSALLKISGDADNKLYKSEAYNIEHRICLCCYIFPSLPVVFLIFYFLLNLSI